MTSKLLAALALFALPVAAFAGGEQDEVVLYEGSLKVGDMAPMFSLPDGKGDLVSLEALLQDGPVVVVYYRGVQ